jgi:tetrathionate reductase subunit B
MTRAGAGDPAPTRSPEAGPVPAPPPVDAAQVPAEPGSPAGTPAGTSDWARQALAFTRRRFLLLVAAVAPGVLGAGFLWPRDAASDDGPAPGAGATPGPGTTPAGNPAPAGATDWAFGVDTTACIGCGRCVAACKAENGVPAEPAYHRTWVERHAVAADGTIYVDSPDGGIAGFPADSTAPLLGDRQVVESRFVPRLCMQCENPPCVSVCPVGATYRTADGVVLVDQQRCIGCGYCVVACPYGARYLVPDGATTPTGNAGVADKCTWCYHRITAGRDPACVEVCPVGARIFGDLADPESPIQAIVHAAGAGVLRPELGTLPRVFYVGLDAEVG